MPTRTAASVLGLTASAGIAFGQPVETRLHFEVRHFNAGNNEGWAASTVAAPGHHLEVRAVVSYIGTSTSVVALGQITFQPLISNWALADALITSGVGPMSIGPWGSNITTPPGYVHDAPGLYGRISPWASGVYTTSTFLRGHVHVNPDGSGATYLRIARADVTNWIGVGPTSGSGAFNNTIGSGGVGINQGTIGTSRPSNAPPQVLGTQNLIVFKFGFVLGETDPVRSMVVTAPRFGVGRSIVPATYGQPDTRWHQSENSSSPGTYRTDVEVVDAVIQVYPAPPTFALMGVGLTLLARRRR